MMIVKMPTEVFAVAPENQIEKGAEASLCSPRMSARPAVENNSITRELVVTNKLGIHARPAAMFVKTATRFDCDIFVEKDGEKVNGKSIMGLMMLAAGPGSRLKVQADGDDAARALGELEELLERKFNED
jgi:phosphocarrier protein